MRLLQLNAWSIRLATRVADMVNQEAPDIIALQEVFESDTDIGFFPTLTQQADKMRFHHQFFSPVYALELMGRQAGFGNALLSNLEIQDRDTVFTSREYKTNFSLMKDDYNVRNFQHATVQDQNGKKVHIINHHGYHVPEHKNGNDFTLKACRQILEYTATLQGPIIITGDFNLVSGSESLSIISEHFRNLTAEYGIETTRTDLTHKTEACDFIFVSEGIEVKNFYVSSIVASDHQGLVLDFEVSS